VACRPRLRDEFDQTRGIGQRSRIAWY
jgi:hypothetical protein